MKNLSFMTVFVLMVIVWSCNNASSSDEMAKLRKENDSLKRELSSSAATPASINLVAMPYDKVVDGIKDLYTVAKDKKNMEIPLGWKFEEDKLMAMLDTSENGNNLAVGVMAYPILENNVLKIVLVPYYEDSMKKMHHYLPNDNNIGAYNFSTICPPPGGCVENKAILEFAASKAYHFVGVGVDK